MTRVFGFEILPAPFVVSHLQLGLLLQRLGSPLKSASSERVGVYLTNALTGWQPGKLSKHIPFPDLAQEHADADKVKQSPRVIVVLGNPPYNAFAGVSPEEEFGLVDVYKAGLNQPVSKGGWGIKKFNLDDLYVRFFRVAERRIAEMSGRGVISFISNFSYLSDPSFVQMRKRYTEQFDRIWIDCMNGDSRETGKLTPEGNPDPSVFSTGYNHEGIRVGTAICVMVRKPQRTGAAMVRFKQFWGATKRDDLCRSLENIPFDATYETASPGQDNRYSFQPEDIPKAFRTWPKLTDLCDVAPSNGLMEKRGGALICIDREPLEQRMKDYFDPDLKWEEYKTLHKELTEEQAGFEPEAVRKKVVLGKERFSEGRIMRYAVRPFEVRWCYYTQISTVWNRARPTLWEQYFPGNRYLACRPSGVANPEGVPFYFVSILGDNDFQRGHSYYFPFLLAPEGYKNDLESKQERTVEAHLKANLSAVARKYLTTVGIDNPDADESRAALVWLHALAIGYAPLYLDENADGIRNDWPRIPFPAGKEALLKSAALGARIAGLLDTEIQVTGVTVGSPMASVFQLAGIIEREDGSQIDTSSADLDLTAGWGHLGKDGVTMPARGKLQEREFTADEGAAITESAGAFGLSADEARSLLGSKTCDVYLNEKVFWRNIPVAVWEYYVGGYQVIKKWLSYRERDILGRAMKTKEVVELTAMVRRLIALVLLRPSLDANYCRVRDDSFPWEHAPAPV